MRKTLVLLFALGALVAGTTPMFATTTCTLQNGPGPYTTTYQCLNSSPTSQFNFSYNSGQMCWPYYQGFYNSTGTYGYGTLEYSFTTESGYYYFDVNMILDLNNSHSSSGNRIGVIVYNDTDSTAETLGEINGSGGDICNSYPGWTVYRPAWAGKNLRLVFSTLYWNSDTQFKVFSPSFLQR